MYKNVKICAICGKKFIAQAPNAKYCSVECQVKGKNARRREWEQKSGYAEKQRAKYKEYREMKTREAEKALKEAEKNARINKKRQDTKAKNKRRGKLIEAAEAGDLEAMRLLMLGEYGNASPEYWEAFKIQNLEYAKSMNTESDIKVNNISIQDDNFSLAVSLSIIETGRIEIRSN